MPQHNDDLDDIQFGNEFDDEINEHEAGHGDGAYEEEAPLGKSSSKPQKQSSGLVKKLIPVIGIAVIGAAGYVGYSYYSNSTSLSTARHTTPSGDFPVRRGNMDSPASNQAMQQPHASRQPHLNNAFPSNNGNGNNTPVSSPSFQAPQQARQAPMPLPAQPPQTQAPQPQQDNPFATNNALPPASPNNQAPASLPGSSGGLQLPSGLNAPSTQVSPAQQAPVQAAPAQITAAYKDDIVSVLNDLKSDQAKVPANITDATKEVKTDIDDKAQMLANKIDALQAKAEQLSVKLDGLQAKPKEENKADASRESTGLRKPVVRNLRHTGKSKYRPAHYEAKKSDTATNANNIGSWHMRGISSDYVIVANDSGQYKTVQIGQEIPGAGRVNGLKKVGGKYVIVTSKGTIQE